MSVGWYSLGDGDWLRDFVPSELMSGGLRRVRVGQYPDGEIRLDLGASPTGTVVITAPLPASEGPGALALLLAAGAAARQHGAGRIVAVLPEIPCARQDRPTPGTVELAARSWVSRLLDASDFDAVVTLHPKLSFAESLSRCIVAAPSVADLAGEVVGALAAAGADVGAVVAPDRGARPLAADFADELHCALLQLEKVRLGTEMVKIAASPVSASAAARGLLIVDDMYVSGATLCAAAASVAGGGPVRAFIPNFRPTAAGLRRLDELFAISGFAGLFVPEHTAPQLRDPRILRIPLARLVGNALERTLACTGQLQEQR